MRIYDHAGPKNALDKAACQDWAARLNAHPSGFTLHKFGFTRSPNDPARDDANRVLAALRKRGIEVEQIARH